MGPVKWEQCKEQAEFLIRVKQDGSTKEFPCCKTCWREAEDMKLDVKNVGLLKNDN